MKKSLLIAAMMAFALTACTFGKNTPTGSMVIAKNEAKKAGKSQEEIDAAGKAAYEAAGGYEEELRVYEQFKGKKGIKAPKKPAWYVEPAGDAPAATPAAAAPAIGGAAGAGAAMATKAAAQAPDAKK